MVPLRDAEEDQMMGHIAACVVLLFAGGGCFWLVAHTPRNSPMWIDGPVLVTGIALWCVALVGLIKAAL